MSSQCLSFEDFLEYETSYKNYSGYVKFDKAEDGKYLCSRYPGGEVTGKSNIWKVLFDSNTIVRDVMEEQMDLSRGRVLANRFAMSYPKVDMQARLSDMGARAIVELLGALYRRLTVGTSDTMDTIVLLKYDATLVGVGSNKQVSEVWRVAQSLFTLEEVRLAEFLLGDRLHRCRESSVRTELFVLVWSCGCSCQVVSKMVTPRIQCSRKSHTRFLMADEVTRAIKLVQA